MARKPQLHQSAITTLLQCGEKFRRRNVCNERFPPNPYMIVGTAVDTAANAALLYKMSEGFDMTPQKVKDIAVETVANEIKSRGVHLKGDYEGLSITAIRNDMQDRAEGLAKLWAEELGPRLRPKRVQWAFVIKLKNQPFDLAGTVDVQEVDSKIRDLKTRKTTPGEGIVKQSLQMRMYAAAAKVKGEEWRHAAMDFLVSTSEPKVVTHETIFSEADIDSMSRVVMAASAAIRQGVFLPAKPDDPLCGEKYCEFWETCAYVGNGGKEKQ